MSSLLSTIGSVLLSGFLLAWVVQAAYYRFFVAPTVPLCEAWDDGFDDTETIFVHEAGFIGDGYTQIENIVPTFTEYGDLVAVRYEGRQRHYASKFDAEVAARKTARFVSEEIGKHGYKNVVFFGSSMGGKVSLMASQFLCYEHGVDQSRIYAILADSPFDGQDLAPFQRRAIPLLAALPYIPILGTLMSIPGLRKLLMFALVPPPNKRLVAQLTHDEKKAFLDSVEEARKVKPFFASGQATAIVKPLVAHYPIPWQEGNVIILRSEKDGMVMSSANEKWAHLLGFTPPVFTALGADHCEYGLQPKAYREVLPEVFDYLGV